MSGLPRSQQSGSSCQPDPLCPEQVLVTTDKRNYTAKDALQLLKDLNLTQQVRPSLMLQMPLATEPSCMHADHMRKPCEDGRLPLLAPALIDHGWRSCRFASHNIPGPIFRQVSALAQPCRDTPVLPPAQAAVYPRVHDLTYPLPEVDIRLHCLYGTGMDTDEAYVYDVPSFNASAPPAPKKVVKGPGDGTVNLRSLEACKG